MLLDGIIGTNCDVPGRLKHKGLPEARWLLNHTRIVMSSRLFLSSFDPRSLDITPDRMME